MKKIFLNMKKANSLLTKDPKEKLPKLFFNEEIVF